MSLPAIDRHENASGGAADASPGYAPQPARRPWRPRIRPTSVLSHRASHEQPGSGVPNACRNGLSAGTPRWCACDCRVRARTQAESFARPRRRRDARIERPARVRIRRRKPCFFERRRVFGWKVRLDTSEFLLEKSDRSFDGHRSPTSKVNHGHAAVVGQDYPTVRGLQPAVKLMGIRQPDTSRPRDTPMAINRLSNSACRGHSTLLTSPPKRLFHKVSGIQALWIHSVWKTMWTPLEANDE